VLVLPSTSLPTAARHIDKMSETVAIKKLNDRNYSVWSRQMKFFLESRDVWGAIEGTDDGDAKSSKAKAFIGMLGRCWKPIM
jgi:hypothetical protein